MTKRKKTKKMHFNLSNEYMLSWKYVKESKKFIYAAIVIFVFFALAGFFIPAPQIIQEKITSLIKEMLLQTKDMHHSELIQFIIFNNIKSTFFSLFAGILFGIFPLAGALANGYMLGFVSMLSVNEGGVLTLWKLLPHGIFELPAVFIALGMGLKIGTFFFQKKKSLSFRYYLINSLRVFLLVVIPLLVIAGIIEGTLIFLMR